MRPVIDLHTHSSVSDGTETPQQLVRAAVTAGVSVMALTDHDSTAGWSSAAEAARGTGLTVIPGMELSTRQGSVSVHMLAYLFDPTNPDLVAETARIRSARLSRAESIVARISADYDLHWDDVVAQTSEGATVGRPHIADAMVARGMVANRSAAFAGILHPAGGYYEPIYAPSPLEAVALVRAAGGVPVLAHPATRGRTGSVPEAELKRLVDAGLFGVEVDHRENTAEGKDQLRAWARRYGLAMTGASDYHGTGKPNRLGENTTTPEVLDSIIAAASGAAPFAG